MHILRLPKSQLYGGLARLFIVIAVVWTGLILLWIRNERFEMVRPDAETVDRVDRWFAEIAMLKPSDSGQFDGLTAERLSLIQKATNSAAYYINGREQKLTASQLKACRAILESGFSEQVKVTLVRTCKDVEPARSLSGMQYSDYRRFHTPAWDFRGVDGLDLETLASCVQGIICQLNEIQISEGIERHFALGSVEKFRPSGEFTGLLTEKDLALVDDLWAAQKNRWVLKPLFWIAAWLVPIFASLLATVLAVELVRWIIRGFRQNSPGGAERKGVS